MNLAREYELISRIAELEKRVAALEKKETDQPRFVPCQGVGTTKDYLRNPTDPGKANPE